MLNLLFSTPRDKYFQNATLEERENDIGHVFMKEIFLFPRNI